MEAGVAQVPAEVASLLDAFARASVAMLVRRNDQERRVQVALASGDRQIGTPGAGPVPSGEADTAPSSW